MSHTVTKKNPTLLLKLNYLNKAADVKTERTVKVSGIPAACVNFLHCGFGDFQTEQESEFRVETKRTAHHCDLQDWLIHIFLFT